MLLLHDGFRPTHWRSDCLFLSFRLCLHLSGLPWHWNNTPRSCDFCLLLAHKLHKVVLSLLTFYLGCVCLFLFLFLFLLPWIVPFFPPFVPSLFLYVFDFPFPLPFVSGTSTAPTSMGTGPELGANCDDDETVPEPNDVPALRFHKFFDFKYCTMNSRMALYDVRYAEFMAIWGANALGATSDKIANFKSPSKSFPYSLSYLAISPSHSSKPRCHWLSLVGNVGFERARSHAYGLCLFSGSNRACMRRHNSNPFLSGTNIAIAGISPAWHCPTKMANKLVDSCSSASVISTKSISFGTLPFSSILDNHCRP